jgi:hypothetical protein
LPLPWISLHTSPGGHSAVLVHGLTTQTEKLPLSPPTVIVCISQVPACVHCADDVHGPLQ